MTTTDLVVDAICDAFNSTWQTCDLYEEDSKDLAKLVVDHLAKLGFNIVKRSDLLDSRNGVYNIRDSKETD